MTNSPPHYGDLRHQSLYDVITGWASHAQQRLLAALAAAGLVAGIALVVSDWRRVPIAGLLLIASAVGAWGLLEQRTATPHSVLIRVLQGLLVLLGTIAAIMGGFALLFWVMGPAPVL